MKRLMAGASFGALATLLLATGSPTQAAEPEAAQAPSATPGYAGSYSLGEVVVTAQKRAENVQKVAAAISAVGRVQIEQQRINTNNDLKKLSPGVNVTEYFNIPSINIRGLGNEASNPSGDASVLMYIDGVYQARPTGTTSAFEDLERLEVLRGPQGTLYGRNATGGIVNLITRGPSDTFGANAYVGYGSYNEVKATGGIEGPLTTVWDTSARVTFYHDSHDGTLINTYDGQHTQSLEADGARATLVTHPTSNLKVTVRGDYYHDRLPGDGYDMIACEPLSDTLLSSPCNPAGLYSMPTLNGAPNPNYNPALAAKMDADMGIASVGPNDGIHFSNNNNNIVTHSNYGASVTVDWDVTPEVALKSISSYRISDYYYFQDFDGSRSFYSYFDGQENSHAWTQELDVNGHTGNGAVWSAGVFAFNEIIGGRYPASFPGLAAQYDYTLGVPYGTLDPATFDNLPNLETTSLSAYAQATAPITDQIKITAGVRENYDLRAVSDDFIFFGSTLCEHTYRGSWANTTWKTGLDYQVTLRNLLYATVSSGFKAGGINEGACGQTFDPETLLAYEVGSKNIFFDGKLLINADVFLYDYQNLQVDILTGSTVNVVNAGKARVGGAELEVQGRPLDHLTLSGNLAWVDSRFTYFPSVNPIYGGCATVPTLPECVANAGIQNLAGNQLPHSPTWTINGQAEYVVPLPSLGDDFIRLHYDVSFNSGWYGDPFNQQITHQKAYTVHNASVAFDHKNYEFGAFVDNFTNELFAESKFTFSTSAVALATWAPLRWWGVYIKAKF